MKIRVTPVFRDKFDFSHIFNVGEIVDFPDDRAGDILKRGLGKEVSERKPRQKKNGK